MSEMELLVQQLEKQNELFAQALDLKEQKAVGGVMTANKLHGLNGLWSNISERDVVSAHIRPTGISNILPAVADVMEDKRYGILTGYTAAGGAAEPTNACDDAPSGFVKACSLTARFGMLRRDTNEIEINKTMLRVNRGDFVDLQLRGQVLGLTNLNHEIRDGHCLSPRRTGTQHPDVARYVRRRDSVPWSGLPNCHRSG
jgi:hypothetical protein